MHSALFQETVGSLFSPLCSPLARLSVSPWGLWTGLKTYGIARGALWLCCSTTGPLLERLQAPTLAGLGALQNSLRGKNRSVPAPLLTVRPTEGLRRHLLLQLCPSLLPPSCWQETHRPSVVEALKIVEYRKSGSSETVLPRAPLSKTEGVSALENALNDFRRCQNVRLHPSLTPIEPIPNLREPERCWREETQFRGLQALGHSCGG